LNELVAQLPAEDRRKIQVTFAAQRTEAEQAQPAAGDIEELKQSADVPARADEKPAENTKAADESTPSARQAEKTDSKRSGEPAPIIIAPGPDGIVIASEDMEALDDLEALIRGMASRTVNTDRDFTVFYLKYAKAQVVAELLEQIFGGGSSTSGGGRSFMSDIAGAAFGDGMMSNLLFGGGGDSGTPTTIRATGTVAIVPDSRLNALVVQANAADLDTVEQLLKVLDQKSSPEDVLVLAKPQIIPVYNTSAEEVANVVRQVYADRIAGPAGQQRQPNPEDFIRALRGGGRGGRGGGRNSNDRAEETQKMTVGVDARTNSLVVSAPDNLFNEVKLLVQQLDTIDTGANETMKVVTLKRSNPSAVQTALQQIVGEQLRTSTQQTASNTRNNNNSGRNQGGGGNQNRQRAQGFNNIFGGGGFQGGGAQGFQGGGGFGGRGFGGGGGGFGGGGNFGGGGGRGGGGGGGGGRGR
jgi:type II secretory pathway component GspD/PulD (secretin)